MMLKPVLAGLGATALALCGVITAELVGFSGSENRVAVVVVRPVAGGTAAPTGNDAPDNRRESVPQILARPLFSPTRRPAPPEAVAEPARPRETPLPRLAGVLVNGKDRWVIFVATGGGKPLVLGEGANVAGFIVHAIEPGSVTLTGPDSARVLRPQYDETPNTGSTNAAAPAGLPGLPGLPGFVPFAGQRNPAPPMPSFAPHPMSMSHIGASAVLIPE